MQKKIKDLCKWNGNHRMTVEFCLCSSRNITKNEHIIVYGICEGKKCKDDIALPCRFENRNFWAMLCEYGWNEYSNTQQNNTKSNRGETQKIRKTRQHILLPPKLERKQSKSQGHLGGGYFISPYKTGANHVFQGEDF